MKSIFFKLITLVLIMSCVHKQETTIKASSAQQNPKVLMILSGSDRVTTKEGNIHRTGFFLSELAGPAIAMEKAGFEIVVATPEGKTPSMDPNSDDVKWFKTPEGEPDPLKHQEALNYVSRTLRAGNLRSLESLTEEDLREFIGVFVPGGHAPLEDLARSKSVGRILKHFHEWNKPTALICHGPAALLPAVDGDRWIYEGYKMTAFSTAEEQYEEESGDLEGHMFFYLDEALRSKGGIVEVKDSWTSSVVRDRELITGQNPMSEEALTGDLLEALIQKRFQYAMPSALLDGQEISENQLHSVIETSFNADDWDNGYRTIWIGVPSADAGNFWNNLTPHVQLTAESLRDLGLEGYVIFGTQNYEIAYQRWPDKATADKAFASAQGQAVFADATRFMSGLLFKEITANPFER
ncbi:MAG: type 1 glutamine amidotransferase domain-containing protein [Oligoflexales bacterium]